MGFIGKEIDRSTAKQLIKQYKLTRPWPSSNNFLESSIIALAYNEEADAICVSVQSQYGVSLNGIPFAGGLPQINVLIWNGYKIRIDLYESFMGLTAEEFNSGHGRFKEFMLIAKRIVAPVELRDKKQKIAQLAEEGSLALHRTMLSPRDSQKNSSFRGVDVTFVKEDEIWKL